MSKDAKSKEEQLAEDKILVHETFELLDKNNDEEISPEELIKGIIAIGFNPTKAETDKIIAKFSSENKGRLNYEEFEKFMLKKMSQLEYERKLIKHEFQKLDRNKDGYVDINELERLLTCVGEAPMTSEEVHQWLSNFDKNSDNKLDYEEFTEMFTKDFLSI